MKKMDRFQTILNWLEKEKKKDKIQLEKSKLDYINEIKGLDKSQIFKNETKKMTLWEKIKIIILGN